ncbi:gfo/Idh/MocA family oxidoreductase [Parablautia intestinalis]|uniref:Gfo/Idh/MocA family oxidoreductase n=1 Tax=Parablautia intestinalis TaxID=2320100 RepID=A0A3A9B3M7_9FIRM|nr:Gfo/Idh/MocA family oxidoreductase [Parablautia intestinalis]RKI93345.1 gfo/Idh/MocA family oxidoreductase [Parablautia intestinalis]
MKGIKTAIVGCGVISDVYMRSFKENFSIIEPVACADLDESKMNELAQRYQIKPMCYDDILKDESIEMIINLTSPKAHYSLSKQAILSGKHVYSEKMMAVTYEEGKELCELALEHHVRFGAAPDTFLGGGIQTARYAVERGLVGKVLSGVLSLTRDYGVFGENLPHLFGRGGSVLYDMGGYYLTAVCSILGGVSRIASFGMRTEDVHKVTRVGSPLFGKDIPLEEDNVITAILEFQNKALITLHLNSGTIINESYHLELYGDKGILRMGDPNTFCGKVILEKAQNEQVILPFTHGFQRESRGLGAAEMAWSILEGRPHRASMEMALHVMEIMHGITTSADSGKTYRMKTKFKQPKPLPEGFIGEGFWAAKEESALL